MRIIICYPPLNNEKGCPTLGQNRQFQYFKEPAYIYPVVPALAASLLKESGYEVIWLDCIAENISLERFFEIVNETKPDLIAFETKTPVVKQHWKIINELKTQDSRLTTILFGDHVTALPEESFQNSKVDYVLTGGDYDFLLLNLCNVLNHKLPNTKLEPGIYYRENNGSTSLTIKDTGKFELNHDLNSLPFIDRDLTKWQLYAYKNGNYKKTPGTYIMSGRDCWWGKCSFCSWPALYPEFRARKPENVLDEIGMLIEKYKVREIMDDTGSFPIGDWLKEFSNGMIKREYQKKINIDCNMRFGALSEDDFLLMKRAGFRLILFGLESANQRTLERLNKNLKAERIIQDCKAARKCGLKPHITIMFGYPWENYEDNLNTLRLGKWLLKKGYAYTMQATLVVPYPGTPLFEECKQNGWLKSLNWDDYDMRMPVMQAFVSGDRIKGLVRDMYKVSFQPEFILRKLFSFKDFDDLRYSLRIAQKVAGHIFDFGGVR